MDEFTGHYFEGREPAGLIVGGDLESTAEVEGVEDAGFGDLGAVDEDADAGSVLARYEAGDQGWSPSADAVQGEVTFGPYDLPREDGEVAFDDLPCADPIEDLLRLEEDS